jgi:hypothetical protein
MNTADLAPFLFVAGYVEAPDPKPGMEPTRIGAAINTATGRVYFRQEEGFSDFLKAGYLRKVETASPEVLFHAWYLCKFGEPAQVAGRGASPDAPSVDKLIALPEKHKQPDGSTLIVAWTAVQRGLRVERHQVRILADGSVRSLATSLRCPQEPHSRPVVSDPCVTDGVLEHLPTSNEAAPSPRLSARHSSPLGKADRRPTTA